MSVKAGVLGMHHIYIYNFKAGHFEGSNLLLDFMLDTRTRTGYHSQRTAYHSQGRITHGHVEWVVAVDLAASILIGRIQWMPSRHYSRVPRLQPCSLNPLVFRGMKTALSPNRVTTGGSVRPAHT